MVLVAVLVVVEDATVESASPLIVTGEDEPESLALEQAAISTNTNTHANL
ncbi:MAG: hypothetical protein ACJZ57_01730 [Candidatus Poriferisodalaceae bacterium]